MEISKVMTDMIQLEPVYMKDAESNLIILDQNFATATDCHD